MGICKGCGQESKLIKAHAIPESFFKALANCQGMIKQLSNTQGSYPKKSPIGPYDENILCRQCEDRFQECDDYGQKILLKEEANHRAITDRGRIVGYAIQNVNYAKFKRFLLTILWRASISNHEYYSKVDLGSYETKLKRMIWDNEIGKPNEFPFIIAKFNDESLGKTMLDPERVRWDQVTYYKFYLYGFIVHIKVDNRNSPQRFKGFEVLGDGNIIVISRDLQQSSELQAMIKIARNATN